MKRFFVSLISTILAFTAGLVTASSWSSDHRMREPVILGALPPCPPALPPPPPAPVNSLTVTPPIEFQFGQNGLRLVPERVQLKSESRGYEIDVSYPQIIGTASSADTKLGKVNKHLKDAATKLYQRPLSQAEQMDHSLSGIHNTVSFTYQVGLATDSFLSVHFIGYSYDSGSNDQLQDSFAVNYDLTSGKHLKLSELFKPGSNYLELISQYCIKKISTSVPRGLKVWTLAPEAGNFAVWQLTPNGITFNFATCQIAPCAEGDFEVQIPFSELEPVLNPGIPGKFNITYP